MEPRSFLRAPVHSVSELLAQLRTDPTVRTRYRALYGAEDAAIDRAFQGLRLKRLTQTHRLSVWFYGSPSDIDARDHVVQKGTEVFVDRTGRPVLKRSCGNPFTTRLPHGVAVARPLPPRRVVLNPVLTDPVTAPLEPEPLPVVPVSEPAPPTIVPPAPTPAPPAIVPAGPPSLAPLAPFLIGAAIGIATQDNNPPTPPVPEPATLTALGLGLAAFARRRRR
jgi:hypothetical protein